MNLTRPPSGNRLLVVTLCSMAIVIDGYDLIVYGTVVPTLVGGGAEWKLTATQAGQIGAYALAGMLIGAIGIGTITDIVGRRRIMIVCVVWFSLAMALTAASPTVEVFALTRFLAGLGLGGVIPTAIALTIEYAHPDRRNATNGAMFSGYSVGGILVSLIAIAVIPELGWRAMFWIGAGLGLLLAPAMFWLLPESPNYLLARGRREEAVRLAERYGMQLTELPESSAREQGALGKLRALLGARLRTGTLLFWLGTGIGLLLVYGLNTWLAQIMRTAGYPLGASLGFLLALNLGAILATPLLGALADRVGSKVVTSGMFLTAALCIVALTVRFPAPVLYVLVAVAGACTIGTTILVNAYTATFYPDHLRATGVGWTLGVGRLGAIIGPLYGGLVMSSGWGVDANFYAFAIPALLGAFCMLLIPSARVQEPHADKVPDTT
ncbi:aromatic acid/H+ symport family MFS transporter [Pseudonocardia eucalypti]|uniref:Aromatic acid/H+ symport family MFS transporter n=1 Tax=Pseudonocardia eucalypti TaxID=648755 RepID=A0ABP9QU86_9PSEU|nr:AAHS family benzoate transporter-like MFS transporter [Pseudonocardia eucalypti]